MYRSFGLLRRDRNWGTVLSFVSTKWARLSWFITGRGDSEIVVLYAAEYIRLNLWFIQDGAPSALISFSTVRTKVVEQKVHGNGWIRLRWTTMISWSRPIRTSTFRDQKQREKKERRRENVCALNATQLRKCLRSGKKVNFLIIPRITMVRGIYVLMRRIWCYEGYNNAR